jgi:glycerophosphoryl diester phosphodiesterase
MNSNFIQIAHRGHSDFYKDNTVNAFLDAYKNNFDMIELDIVLTKDNQIAVYHDSYINNLLIKDINYTQLKNMDQDIILLTKFFEIIDTNKIKIYLDIKGDHLISKYLHELLKKSNHINLNNIYLASFNTIVLKKLIQYNPNYQLGLITENVLENKILKQFIQKYKLKFIAFGWTVLNKYNIDFLHKNNVFVYTYTCKNNNNLLFIKKYNIDGIVTNYKINSFI